MIISENFLEVNDACPVGVFCCVRDNIRKVYFDRQPFAENCVERIFKPCFGGGDFVTEHDMCYCCYVIPCMPLYDICCRPCWGGYVGRVPCNKEKANCMFLLGTRCCQQCFDPIMLCVGDSEKAKEAMQIELAAFRANGGSDWALF